MKGQTTITSSDSNLTHRQSELTQRIRDIDNEITRLTHVRASARLELERIYPDARSPLVKPPRDAGTILNIFNFQANQMTCHVKTNSAGTKQLNSPKSALQSIDLVILALCERAPADATKLIKLPELKQLHNRPQSRIHHLYRYGLLDLTFNQIPLNIQSRPA